LYQTRHATETQNHESEDSKIKLFSKVCALCEEKGHVIMDCPFVLSHIRIGITRHMELQNVAKALMDQPQEQELGIPVVQNKFRGMELGSQLGHRVNKFVHLFRLVAEN